MVGFTTQAFPLDFREMAGIVRTAPASMDGRKGTAWHGNGLTFSGETLKLFNHWVPRLSRELHEEGE